MKKSAKTKNVKTSKRGKPASSPDKLVKTGKKGGVELTEGELEKASGGIKFNEGKIV